MTFNQWASSHPFEPSLRSSLADIWNELLNAGAAERRVTEMFDELALQVNTLIREAQEAGYESSY